MFRLKVRPKLLGSLKTALALWLAVLSILLVTLSFAQAGPAPGASLSGARKSVQVAGVVRVEPVVSVVDNGETFRVYLMAFDVTQLGAFQFTLAYDPSIIEVPKQTNPVILGDLLGSTGRTPIEVTNELDPVAGVISYAVITTGSSPGANGDGALAFVDLRARALGSSALDLEDVEVVDTGGRQQDMSVGDGQVVVGAPPDPARVTMDKTVDSPTIPPEGVLSFTLDRSLSLAGGHTFEEFVYDPIPSGTSYVDGSATLNGIPAPELYSETLDALYYHNSGSFTDDDQWTIGFQVEVGVLANGTVVVNTVTETVSFDGAGYTGPYTGTASSTVFNNPPNTPSSPSPADGATGVAVSADLSWTGGDPDPGDTVTYDVYFEADDSTPDVLLYDDIGTPTCDPGTLAHDKHYYWTVIATDSHGASTTGSTWDFTTGSVPNNPPNTPSSPSPADGATGVSVSDDLSWTGGDPDPGDTVIYDVYFEAGDSTPDFLLCNDVGTTTCDPGTLAVGTHYYWYVVATDNHGASTASPTWGFTTECPLPASPLLGAPVDGSRTTDTTPNFAWLAVIGASTYRIQVDDNSDFSSPEIETDTPDLEYEPTLPLSLSAYSWRVLATNSCGDGSWSLAQSFTLVQKIYLPAVMKNYP